MVLVRTCDYSFGRCEFDNRYGGKTFITFTFITYQFNQITFQFCSYPPKFPVYLVYLNILMTEVLNRNTRKIEYPTSRALFPQFVSHSAAIKFSLTSAHQSIFQRIPTLKEAGSKRSPGDPRGLDVRRGERTFSFSLRVASHYTPEVIKRETARDYSVALYKRGGGRALDIFAVLTAKGKLRGDAESIGSFQRKRTTFARYILRHTKMKQFWSRNQTL